MDPGSHSPSSEINDRQVESPSPQGDVHSNHGEERTPTPPTTPPPDSQNSSSQNPVESQLFAELKSELQEKQSLVETLTQQLEQVVERLDHDQHHHHDAVAEHRRVVELETELREKEKLVATLKERLGEIVEQLKQSQQQNEQLTAENQRVKELEAELQEKEQLVVLLTERLEQVAEQLDRRHRTGADRGMTISGGGVPPEFIEEQQKLSQDLQAVMEQWQGMNTEASLARIEMQISELKKMVEDGIPAAPAAPAQPSSLVEYLASPAREVEEDEPERIEEEAAPEEPEVSPAADEGAVTGWEAMKQKLLSGQGVDVNADLARKPKTPPPAPPTPTPQPVAGQSGSDSGEIVGRPLSSYKPPLPEAPAEIDYEEASKAEFIEALKARDHYICQLIKRVREAETALIPVNWEMLNNAPEDLLEQLQTLHHDLEHNLGLAEVEISIERARLSRTESMLQGREEEIRKKEKKLGLNMERSEEGEVADEEQLDDDQKKRWLGFLN